MRTGYDTGFGISRTGDVGLENEQWVTHFNRALKNIGSCSRTSTLISILC